MTSELFDTLADIVEVQHALVKAIQDLAQGHAAAAVCERLKPHEAAIERSRTEVAKHR